MTDNELKQLTNLGEGFTSEFKQGCTTLLGHAISSFVNATGGISLVGVTVIIHHNVCPLSCWHGDEKI